jgi:hypothetical protein
MISNRINLIIGVGAILMVGMSSEYAFAYAPTDHYLIGYTVRSTQVNRMV